MSFLSTFFCDRTLRQEREDTVDVDSGGRLWWRHWEYQSACILPAQTTIQQRQNVWTIILQPHFNYMLGSCSWSEIEEAVDRKPTDIQPYLWRQGPPPALSANQWAACPARGLQGCGRWREVKCLKNQSWRMRQTDGRGKKGFSVYQEVFTWWSVSDSDQLQVVCSLLQCGLQDLLVLLLLLQ